MDRQFTRESTNSEAAIPEPSPSPAIPRWPDALQARWDEVLGERAARRVPRSTLRCQASGNRRQYRASNWVMGTVGCA